MKNSFCRICRGRFNLKYPPAAVDSENKNLSSRIIAVRIEESGEISENICWDCEDTLLGFNKSVGGDNEDEEEPVVVDDDEILYKTLEKTRRFHRTSKEIEIIQIDSSDSEHEERVIVPKEDDTVKVEAANTVVESSKKSSVIEIMDNPVVAESKNSSNETDSDSSPQKNISFTRGNVVESMRCPLCPYLSGVEYEVVLHIRRTHPHYTGEHLNFEQKEGDSILTRRIIFVNLWTFFECKECGKIHDRFWPHRKHLTAHDRKNTKSTQPAKCPTVNNNKVFIAHDSLKTVQTSKRALDSLENIHDSKQPKFEERVLRRTSKDNSTEAKEKLPADTSKSLQTVSKKHQRDGTSKKSNSKGLLRKQQLLQAKREKRLQKRMKEKKSKSKKVAKPEAIPKPTFKMPQLPAPRASSVVKQLSHHPRFTCKLCSQTISSFINWNMHMLRTHSALEFKQPDEADSTHNMCRKCDKNFSNALNLRAHIRLSHRRKNRLVEINGNDDEEICRQTLTPKKESKEEAEDRLCLPPLNGVSKAHNMIASSSALLCQYCGMLFASLVAMRMHETTHAADADVKRIFKIKPQA